MKKILAFLLLVANYAALAHADNIPLVDNTVSTINKVTPDKDTSVVKGNVAENFSQQWGMAAIKIPTPNTPAQLQAWSASISSVNPPTDATSIEPKMDLSNIYSSPNSINAAYTNGRFRAETGLLSNSSDVLDSRKFYLQGSYAIFTKEKFNLAVTAKIEAVDNPLFNAYIGEVEPIIDAKTIFEHQTKNATIGVISSYSINKQWKVLGSITTTTYEQALQKNPLVDINNSHMALIGTSYSF